MSPWKAAKLQTLIRLTKLDCQTITASIKQYYNDYQRYPTRKEQKANTDGSDLTYNSEAASNSDAIVILMANSQLSDVNQGHRRNPKKFRYFDPKMVEGQNSHGVGSDGIFRDPWGNPYIITVDFNGNNKCFDFFCGNPVVSGNGTDRLGHYGLLREAINEKEQFYLPGTVMVWSKGPDRKADPTINAQKDVYRDNVVG